MVSPKNSIFEAKLLDKNDELRKYRDKFHIPILKEQSVIYLCGNSLGLQPKTVRPHIDSVLEKWSKLGVLGHHKGENPWIDYTDNINKVMASIVGGKISEVVVMNSLTVNLHILLVSFYRPQAIKNKILIDGNAFCSDRYAVYSQVEYYGLDPNEVIIEIKPRENETFFREEDVIELMEKHSGFISTVFLEGVNFYNGKAYDLKRLVEAGHKIGAIVGFDLAHAAGNIELKLNEWDVDFACWCTYKYLNGGPGSLGCIFVHENHHNNDKIPILSGWWSNKKETRFLMENTIDKFMTAEKWQLSNPSILAASALKASLELFSEVGMEALIKKSKMLTSYLEFLLLQINKNSDIVSIITPKDYRGCQLSIVIKGLDNVKGKKFVEDLLEHGVVVDWRQPNVIRCAPVPFYNTFEEIFRFTEIFISLLKNYEILKL